MAGNREHEKKKNGRNTESSWRVHSLASKYFSQVVGGGCSSQTMHD